MRNFWKKIGPGFITGAADDDPSGVGTYSVAGAAYGYAMSWMSLFLVPAMVAVQEMCGRIGLVSGNGLIGVMKKHYSKKLVYFVVLLLLVANVVNIAADLGIMASSLVMLLGGQYWLWMGLVASVLVALEILVPYRIYSNYLKWFGSTLLVYVITALMVQQDWMQIAKNTLLPSIQFDSGYLMTLVGFLGTTISPYLFFWQAGEEVEESILKNEISDFGSVPEKVSLKRLRGMRMDTVVGMIFSNLMTFFIILTTAATLHRQGITQIESPQQAAMALKPLAGDWAYLLFTLGILGIGIQSVPVLAGSLSYAMSEAFGWKEGLGKKFGRAKKFYTVIALASVFGVFLNMIGINVIQALVYAAIINGIVAVPMIYVLIKMSNNSKIVGENKSSKLSLITSWLAFLLMGVSCLLMFWSVIKK